MQTHKWRLWCSTDSKWVYSSWADSEPSQCPENAGHSIDASKTAIIATKKIKRIPVSSPLVAVDIGVSDVIANGRPAIEIQNDITGFGATTIKWPEEKDPDGVLKITAQFVLKEVASGTNIRLAAKAKASAIGEDSSLAFSPSTFIVVDVSTKTADEVIEATIDLDGSDIELGDSVAMQIGRDGDNNMGAGTNDDYIGPIQIVSFDIGLL